jgi:hypothetical protein
MSNYALFARLAKWATAHKATLLHDPHAFMPSRKQLKRMRPKRFKPAFSMGYRGFPKTMTRPGSIDAPTIDQVRNLERKHGQRLHVKHGVLFFKTDGIMFTREEAERRHKEKACGTV